MPRTGHSNATIRQPICLLTFMLILFSAGLWHDRLATADEEKAIATAQSDLDFGSSKKEKIDKIRFEEERFDAVPAGPITELPRLVTNLDGFSSLIMDIGFHPDGKHIAVACANEIQIWDIENDHLVTKIRGAIDTNSGGIYDVAYSPGGTWLLIGIETTRGSYVRCCRTDDYTTTFGYTGAEMEYARGGYSLDFSGDGNHFITQTYFEEYINDDPDDYTTETVYQQTLYGFIENPVGEEVDPIVFEDIDSSDETTGAATFYGSDRYAYDALGDRTLDVAGKRWVPGAVGSDTQWLSRLYKHTSSRAEATDSELVWFDADVRSRLAAVAVTVGSSGAARYQVDLYRGDSLTPFRTYKRVSWEVTALDISTDCKRLAIGDALGNFQVIDVATGKRLFYKQPTLRPLYAASLDVDSGLLGFGHRTHTGSAWRQNDYADIDQAFDLVKRQFVDSSNGQFQEPITSLPAPVDLSVHQTKTEDGYYRLQLKTPTKSILKTEPQGSMVFSWHLQPGPADEALILYGGTSFLQAETLGSTHPSNTSIIAMLSGECEAIATDITSTKDLRHLVTAWSDGIVRIYRNSDLTPQKGFQTPFVFDYADDSDKIEIIEIRDAKAAGGLRVGDVITAVNGLEPMLFSRRSNSEYGFEADVVPGSPLLVTRENGEVVKTSYAAYDDHFIRSVSPVLSFLSTSRDDWILFTPEGFFDASPSASRLIGWQRNRDFDQTAEFFAADSLRRKLLRPDLIQERVREILGRPATTTPAPGDNATSIPDATSDANLASNISREPAPDLREPASFNEILPPRLRIEGIPESGKTNKREIELVITAAPQNNLRVHEIIVLSGGRPTGTMDNVQRLDDGKVVLTTRVKLNPGENELSFIATNEAASSPRRTVNVTCTARQLASGELQPRLFILSIGVSKYAKEEFDLKYPSIDATSFAKLWEPQQGPFYREVQAKILVDEHANRTEILDGMDWLVRSVTQRDLAMVFIAGHATMDTRNKYYFCTHEMDPKRLRSTALPYSEIVQLIQDLPCKVLLFADTCHSGAATGALGATRSFGDEPWSDIVSDEIGAVLFASSMPRQLSMESDIWGHGAFTRAIIDGMTETSSDIDGDGYINLIELDQQISNRVQKLTEGQQTPSTAKPSTIGNFKLATMLADTAP
ncbi:caspase family protein [Aporhodopirellula aestuarii]|uniref:Caspase family protein n=1 Tax=Aporhodopirellula aestuarii TaxID=2950107 RepID=A0ABT0TXM1_9BACT|nr:caspase family protein [Aporhodopirellula aestuarii]MCM2369320.1 caspase family protein [Aporhodopirellula aestuarii]